MTDASAITFSSVGYFLEPGGGEGSAIHTMCGPHSLPGAISPNSGAPLLLVATLDLRDPVLGASSDAVERLHLLYSWACPISEGLLSYRETTSGVQLLEFKTGNPIGDFPYPRYPAFFPQVDVRLRRLTAHEQDVIAKLNRRMGDPILLEHTFPHLAAPRSQVGGEPRLMQWPLRSHVCVGCGLTMRLLASIGNANGSDLGFTGNEYVQMLFYFCESCSIVTAENLTD